MNRDEFLRRLKAELTNFVSDSVIQEQLNYYYGYMQEQMLQGFPEEDVVEALGDVRLIAKSIIEAAEAGGDRVANTTPFRYSEEEINYNTDEEDLNYQGAQEDSESSYDPFQSFRQKTEQESSYAQQETSYDGQTVENESKGRRENPFEKVFSGGHVYQMGNLGCLITGIVLFLLLWALGSIIGGIFQVLSPVLIPILVVAVLLWLFKGIMS